MSTQRKHRSLQKLLPGMLVVGLAMTSLGGCGDDEPTPTPDAGTTVDAGTDAGTTDAGTDAGTTDAGTDAGTVTPDTDLAFVRFNTNGTVDNTFGAGGNGIARLNLGAGAGTVRDSMWSLSRDAQDRLVVFGTKKAEGTRTDTDRVVARLTAGGALDETFNAAATRKGLYVLDIGGLGDSARHGFVQADGKILSAGYLGQPTGVGAQSANRIVLMRLDEAGTVDATFGSKGVLNSAPFATNDPTKEWGISEAYAAVRQSTGAYVTTGYGRAAGVAGNTVDLISFRYSAAGVLDSTYGTNGAFILNLNGDNDRGRDAVVLKDDSVFMVGSGTVKTGEIDAMAVQVTANGQPATVTGFNEGFKTYDFGRTDEAFYDVATFDTGSAEYVAAAGYSAKAGEDDDAILLIRNVTTGQEFNGVVAFSDTANDRLWGVTFGQDGKVYATGFVTEGGDNRFAVARFNLDGTRDTTFGTGGIVTVNVIAGKLDEAARSVVVQSDGKIVIAGAAEAQ
ncbi:hypothetical protein [Corallococcus llansteffanensis]|uniref:Delta-60 repeat domain-containing protein n=1 Tax=Corallococcus llansteffanensis TaxID=2316731 RepID=A0A3A8PMA7_9BACT|nr:hypothetical protein [Corallococcus llansteffanensis]RKH52744.1 hypothetical protein D7V93_27580 [Corallococcus llansteffanensis]